MRLTFSILVMTATMATILATTATASPVTSILNYQSSVSSDNDGLLDLKAELNYNTTQTGAPIAVLMHPYSGSTGHFDNYRENAQRLRDAGFFVVSPAMRGREGSDGVRDSGGLEIYDIYDAVESVKANYGSLVDSDCVYITGYSGGGGNVMSAITKFPDYFTAAAAFFGMSDYGYDTTDGWYYNGAEHRTATLNADIGDPTTGDTDVIDRYHARASNLASKNNPYTEIHLFVNNNETICPPVNDTSFKNNAVAAATTPGEFDNITVHTGVNGTYEDFDGDGINDANEHQWWPHDNPTADVQHAAEAWFMDRLTSGQIASPTLNSSDELFVAGFVKTKQFSCWLGDGQNAAGELDYDLSATEKSFELQIVSNNQAITGELSVDTADMLGRRVEVRVNGTATESFGGGGVYSYEGLSHGDFLEFVDIGAMAGPACTGDINPADPMTWDATTVVYVGNTGDATMDVTDGVFLKSHKSHIAYEAGTTSVVTVTGVNSSWGCEEKMYIGYNGSGTMSITSGGTVCSADTSLIAVAATSTSSLSVDGEGSTWSNGGNTFVGGYGNGTLNVTNGGAVSTTVDGNVGYKADSTGLAELDGAGSSWTCGEKLLVGDAGEGTMNVKNGASAQCMVGYVGFDATGTGVVSIDGVGSAWNNSENLYVGNLGGGTMTITNGATVSCNQGLIGNETSGVGVVTVDGAGSAWTNMDRLYIGQYGNGTLNVLDGGSVASADYGFIGTKADSVGVVTIDGESSTCAHQGQLYIGNVGNATLNITGGGLVSVSDFLTIGNTENADGTINMSTGGMLALAGNADDSLSQFIGLIMGYQSDNINWWNDSLGDWAPLSTATLGEDYTLQYIDAVGDALEGYTVLTVGELPDPWIPGDANHDGKVDGSDVTILANNWQAGVSNPDPETITWEMGDFNRDGKVDGSDVTILANNWQKGVTNTSGTAVPEPSVALLVITGLWLLLWRR